MPLHRLLPPASLMLAATLWGVVWYPYRLLEEAGMAGITATLLTYIPALAMLLLLHGGRCLRADGEHWTLLAVALAAGWTNIAYVLAVIDGEIMRVLLLFYLAPLWTVAFARLFLGERPGLAGFGVMALALGGALVMLWRDAAWPLPENSAEWLGLSAGVAYALANVLSRHLRHVATSTRSAWIFIGVLVLCLPIMAWQEQTLPASLDTGSLGLLLLTGAALVLATLAAQWGLAATPANRAIVILLLELVVAAFFSWYWAGEVMDGREWLGGAMIVAASLFSEHMEEQQREDEHA